MSITSLALTTSATASAADLWDLVATAAVNVRLMELHIFLNTAVATKVGLFRTSAEGTRTSPTTFNNEDPNDQTPLSTSALAWSVAATKAATALRRLTLPATIGAGIISTWGPRGLVIPKGTTAGLILSNTAGAVIGLLDITAVVDEYA
jgi:hypothetical protein